MYSYVTITSKYFKKAINNNCIIKTLTLNSTFTKHHKKLFIFFLIISKESAYMQFLYRTHVIIGFL